MKFNQFHKADQSIQNQFSLQSKNFRERLKQRKYKAMSQDQNSLIQENILEEEKKDILDNQKNSNESFDSDNKFLNSSILKSKSFESIKKLSNGKSNKIQKSASSAEIYESDTFTEVQDQSKKTIPTLVNSEVFINTEFEKSYIEAQDYLKKIEESMDKRVMEGDSVFNISDHQIELIDDKIKEQFIKNYEKYQSTQDLDDDDDQEENEENRILIEESKREILLFQKNEQINNDQFFDQYANDESLESDLLLNSCDVFLNQDDQNILNNPSYSNSESQHPLLLNEPNHHALQNNYFMKQNKIENPDQNNYTELKNSEITTDFDHNSYMNLVNSEIGTEFEHNDYMNLPNHSQKSIEESKNNLISDVNIHISNLEFDYTQNDNDDFEDHDLTQSKENNLMASNLSYDLEQEENMNSKETPDILNNIAIEPKLLQPHQINPSKQGFEKSIFVNKKSDDHIFEEVNDKDDFLISTIGYGMISEEPGVINVDYIPDSMEQISAQRFGDSLAEYNNLKTKEVLNKDEEEKYKQLYLEQNFQSDISIGNDFDDDIRISKELEQINLEIENSRLSMTKSTNTIKLIEELNEQYQENQIKY